MLSQPIHRDCIINAKFVAALIVIGVLLFALGFLVMRIADNMHYHFQRQNGMDIDWTTQLYNQATFIGSAVMLYKATGEKAYLDDAVLAADYVRNEMCDADGEFRRSITS